MSDEILTAEFTLRRLPLVVANLSSPFNFVRGAAGKSDVSRGSAVARVVRRAL